MTDDMTDDELCAAYRVAKTERAVACAAMVATPERRRYMDAYARLVALEAQMWGRGLFLEDIPREGNT